MSHGGGGGFGHGGHHGGHHGLHSTHGGEPQASASWNMAYAGSERKGFARIAGGGLWPIFLGLFVFVVMLLPFVLDWEEPHLQRLLIGHDLTAKEIAHNNAVDQAMAGTMNSQMKKAFGEELGGQMLPAPPMSGSSLIAEPPAPSSIPENNQTPTGLGNFKLSTGDLSTQLAPAQNYYPNYAAPQQTQAPAGGGFNQRFISQPAAGAYMGQSGAGYPSSSAIDYHAPRHRVVVDR